MILSRNILLVFGISSISQEMGANAACESIQSITCTPTTTAPTLDGNADDWTSVAQFETPMTDAHNVDSVYPHGSLKVKCVYDSERIYFLFEIPGQYKFDSGDDHLCAAVSTMFRMGEGATLKDMGGCPSSELTAGSDCAAVPGDCDDYKVDIGCHWELKTTEMNVFYDVNGGTGDDSIANKDDEYSVSPWCRFDDDDANAANEWQAAWSHDNAVEGSDGTYIFEMSRTLSTASTESDAQLQAGSATDFGFAFWDPFESESGWNAANHYVTGCSNDWISLRLVDENGELAESSSEGTEPVLESDSGSETEETSETSQASTEGNAAAVADSKIFYALVAMVFANIA